MNQKFHINSAGDVRVCNATLKPCRFGDSDHFTDRTEARKAVEERLSKEMPPLESQNKRKSTNAVDSGSAVSPSSKADSGTIQQIQLAIQETAAKKRLFPEDFQNLGKLFEAEAAARYAVDPFSRTLTGNELEKVGEVNRALLADLVETGAELPNPVVTGARSDTLRSVVKDLPNAAKDLIKNRRFEAAAISAKHKSNATHMYGDLYSPVEYLHTISRATIPADAADGDLFVPKAVPRLSELQNPNAASLVTAKNGDSVDLKVYWIGKPARDKSYTQKKIADSAEIFINGAKVRIDKPLYEVGTYERHTGSKISGPKVEDSHGQAAWVHEYSHALQINTRLSGYEEEMFNQVAGEKTFSHDYGEIVYKGFPNDYMGQKSKRELFPTATEALLYPNPIDREFFYGKNTHENAAKLRQWTIGMWLTLGRQPRHSQQ
jgi:hypothetical protein